MPYILMALGLLALATGFAVWQGGRGTKGEFSYLLVLGTKVDGESPGKMLRDRIDAAYAYLSAHPDVTAIVSGYRSGTGRISEAECIRRELVAMGIDPDRIYVEDQSTSTYEPETVAPAPTDTNEPTDTNAPTDTTEPYVPQPGAGERLPWADGSKE